MPGRLKTGPRQGSGPARARAFDIGPIRAEFPILRELVHGKPLVYLDSANTSQKPAAVLRAHGRLLPARQREHSSCDAPAE